MKLQFTLDKLSSLLVYLCLPLRLSCTVSIVRTYMQDRALEFTSSTRHFTASSALQVNQHMKLDQAMLFTRQIFASECNITSEWYCSCVASLLYKYVATQLFKYSMAGATTP